MSFRFRCWIALLALALAFGPQARAAMTCQVTSVTDLAFGAVDPAAGMVDSEATIHYSCTFTSSFVLTGGAARLCFNIGTGSGGTSWTPRRMRAGTETMNFQIFTDAARTQVWGGTGSGIPPGSGTIQFPVVIIGSATQSGSIRMHGRVPAGQATLAAGAYSSLFSGAHAQMTYAAAEQFLVVPNPPAGCTGSGTGNFSFTASAHVPAKCDIGTATAMDFGSAPSNFAGNLDRTSTIDLTCTRGTAWQVGLNNGLHALGNQRRMLGAGQHLGYELYRDSGRTLRWGHTINVDTVIGSGSGLPQSLTVHGRVPPQAPVPAGTYNDKITVTVTY